MSVSFVNLVANIVLHRISGVLAACSMSLAWQEALHVFFHMTNAVDAVTLSTCMSVALLNINGVKLCNEMTYQLSDLGMAVLKTCFLWEKKQSLGGGVDDDDDDDDGDDAAKQPLVDFDIAIENPQVCPIEKKTATRCHRC